eukprot:4864719-Prymnesium_polylepis.1
MRTKGFRPPVASDWRVICVWDLKVRSCNSANLQQHLALCEACPTHIKSKYLQNVASSKTAEKRMGKRALDEIAQAAADGPCPPPSVRAKTAEDLRSYSERK